MIAPDTVIARLKDTVVAAGTLRAVGGAGDMAAASDQANVSKMAFVVPANENADPNQMATGVTVQRVRTAFTIFFFVTITDATGAKALNDVFAIREAIKDALVGWTPEGEDSPVQYRDGTVADLDARASFIVYALTFFNTYFMRK